MEDEERRACLRVQTKEVTRKGREKGGQATRLEDQKDQLRTCQQQHDDDDVPARDGQQRSFSSCATWVRS